MFHIDYVIKLSILRLIGLSTFNFEMNAMYNCMQYLFDFPGYVEATVIPKGARNIYVAEVSRAPDNFLAIRDNTVSSMKHHKHMQKKLSPCICARGVTLTDVLTD